MRTPLSYRSSITTLTLLLTVAFASAQVRPGGDVMEYDDTEHTAIALDLNLPVDGAKEHFVDFMKEKYNARVKGMGFLQNRTILSLEQAEIPALHAKAMDLYIRFDEAKGNKEATHVRLIGRNGYDLYFSETYEPETYQRLVTLMSNYRTFALEAHYNALLEDQQDDLKDLERAQRKRTKAVENNLDEQAENRKRNKQLEKEIEDLKKKKSETDRTMEQLREDILRSKAELPGEK